MKEQYFPQVSEALIKALNEKWPERCPEMDWDQKQTWHYVGQRSVVRYLNEVYKDQRDDSLRSS